MIRKTLLTALVLFGMMTAGHAAGQAQSTVGVVNFADCMSESKVGKQEQSSFESLKNQMTSLLEDTEKQINEIATKFNDPDFMDGLSPEAEEEMKNRFRGLNEEMNRYQNQYYQVLNQANMKIVQTMGANIQEAAQKVAQDKKLTMVVNKEACFFHTPNLDVTNFVIAEMDRVYDQNAAKTVNNVDQTQVNKKR